MSGPEANPGPEPHPSGLMKMDELMTRIIADKAAAKERSLALPWAEKITTIQRVTAACRIAREAMKAARAKGGPSAET